MAISFSDLKRPAEDYFYSKIFDPAYRGTRSVYWSAVDVQPEYADVTFTRPSGSLETVSTTGHGSVELDFIRKVFREIDNILEPSFVEAEPSTADITIFSSYVDIPSPSTPGSFSAGLAYIGAGIDQSKTRLGAVRWRDYTGEGDLSKHERTTIVHEIGHVLGLTHPGAGSAGGRAGGDNPAWTQKDSIMSYNWVNGDVSQFFTPLDIQALQSIWGAESDPVNIGWPATNYFPATEEASPVSTAGAINNILTSNVAANNSSEVQQQLTGLASDLVNPDWKDYINDLSGGDSIIDVFVDASGQHKSSKAVKKLGKGVRLSQSEYDFIGEILEEVDSVTGLQFSIVDSASSADIVFSSLKMKKYENHIEDMGSYIHSVWQGQGRTGVLTEFEQVLIAGSVLTSIGMDWSTAEEYSTFDTVLSWNGEDYWGMTQADRTALVSLWGAPA